MERSLQYPVSQKSERRPDIQKTEVFSSLALAGDRYGGHSLILSSREEVSLLLYREAPSYRGFPPPLRSQSLCVKQPALLQTLGRQRRAVGSCGARWMSIAVCTKRRGSRTAIASHGTSETFPNCKLLHTCQHCYPSMPGSILTSACQSPKLENMAESEGDGGQQNW